MYSLDLGTRRSLVTLVSFYGMLKAEARMQVVKS